MEKHISEVININKLQSLLEKFTAATGTTGASVLDNEGKVLATAAWQDICKKFHRTHASSCENCLVSDTILASKIKSGEHFSIYKCLNGMTDVGMPIIVHNKTIGTLFIGQFLSEEPDIDFFKQQAKKFNYNEPDYLEALSKVQIIRDDEVKKKIELLSELTFFIADLGASNLELLESQKHTLKMMQEAKENELTFKKLFEDSSDAILLLHKSGKFVECNQATLNLLKMTKEELLLQTPASISPKYQPNGQTSEKYAEEMIDIAYQNGSHRFDWTHINANREEFIVEVSLMPIVVKGETMLHTTWRDITQRIQNEKELKKAKEKAERNELELKKAQEITHIGSWYLDIETNNVIWTTELYKMYGFDPTLPVPPYTEHMKLFTPESWETLATALENTKQTGTPYELELKTVRTDGGHGWMWVRGEVVKDTNGKTIALWGAAQDITDRKNIELELIKAKDAAQKSEAQFRSLFENMDEGFAIHELIYDKNNKPIDYRFVNLNKGFEKLTGLKKVDLIGKTVKEIMPNIEQVWIDNYGNVAKTGTPFHFENYSQALDKHYNVVAYSPKKDFFAVIFSDVTKVKKYHNELIKAKEKAELNEARLIDAQSVAKVGNWETNLETMEIVWSNETYNIFELDKEDFKNSHPSFLNYVHPDDIERIEAAFAASFSSTNYHSVQHRVITTSKKIKHVQEQWRIIHDKNNKPIKAFGTCQDITKIKQFESELIKAKDKAEESDRLKSAFLANMSHEIRTPMNGILGFSELLKNPNLTGEKQQSYIKIIEKSGNRMLNIINDIIDISKIEAGLMKVDMNETCINEKIDFIYNFFKPQAKEKGLQLIVNNPLSTQEIIINTDTEKFYSVLINLVKNAIKYSDKGSIEIGYSIKNETIEFYVKDTGIGIPESRQKAVFERFIQADILDKEARQGAGLGLSISKAYINMLGGKIWVESNIGKGSTFYFTLPYTTKNDIINDIHNNFELKNEKLNNYNKKLKILIAEDDETSEMLISIIIENISKEIITAKTGNEALEICKKNPDIDLILMDIQMPEMNGYETTKLIRTFNKDVVIIAQTAYGLAGDREKALEIGCNDYISKPIKQSELLSMINKHVLKLNKQST